MAPPAIEAALLKLDAIIAEVKGDHSQPSEEAATMSDKKGPSGQAEQAPNASAVRSDPPPSEPEAHTPPAAADVKQGGEGPLGEPAGAAAAKSQAAPLSIEDLENFQKCLLQVGKVVDVVPHPKSEKLYICQVETSPEEKKQVVAGLQKFISAEELKGRTVCLVCNLKPAKLAGEPSEAMILAADARSPEKGEEVKVLVPPAEAAVGDRIFLDGLQSSGNPPKQLSSKVWEKIVALLHVKDGCATYGGKKLMCAWGEVKVPELPDGSGIH